MTNLLKFKGTFNFYGETYILYTHATNKNLAFINLIYQLVKKLEKPKSQVKMYFNGQIDNYYIEEMKEN